MKSEKSSQNTNKFKFQIYSAYPEDFGKYTCDAGNRYGSATQHMELYSTEMPICPPLCGDTNLNSGMAHFPASYLFSMALALNIILNWKSSFERLNSIHFLQNNTQPQLFCKLNIFANKCTRDLHILFVSLKST